MTANVMPVRLDVTPGMTVREFVRRTGTAIGRGPRHQRYRYEDLARDLGIAHGTTICDLIIDVLGYGYPARFGNAAATARNLTPRAGRGPADLRQRPDDRLDDHEFLDADELFQVVHGWNPAAAGPAPVRVPELFAARAAESPDRTALVGAASLSFAELDARAAGLARHLTAPGTGLEAVVGLCLPPGAEMTATILVSGGAGAAYLPIDAGQPIERTAFMLADSKVVLLVAPGEIIDDLPAGRVPVVAAQDVLRPVEPGGEPRHVTEPANLAYVIYTSGTTGTPKGVAVTHGFLANYVASVRERLGLGGEGERYALLQPQVTDLGNTMLFCSLATGGELHILDPDVILDPAAVAAYLRDYRTDHLKAVPSHLAALGPERSGRRDAGAHAGARRGGRAARSGRGAAGGSP